MISNPDFICSNQLLLGIAGATSQDC